MKSELSGDGIREDSWSVIDTGKMIYDVNGNRMQCHSPDVCKFGDRYYLYGEDIGEYHMDAPYTFRNISCWSTTDFSNWFFEGNVITHDLMVDWGKDGWVIARPHVIYNEKNNEYVMITKFLREDVSDCRMACFTSGSPTGIFVFKQYMHCPDPEDEGKYVGGDGTLFKDADGTVYFAGTSIFNDFHVWIYELDQDYYNLVEGTKVDTDLLIEAVDFIFKDGIYYLIASGLTGYNNNDNFYYTSSSIKGPWENKTFICNPFTGTRTYESQHSKTARITGSEGTTYVFCADAWANASGDEVFRVDSRLLFLPLELNDGSITLNWRNQWKLDVEKGIWTDGAESIWGRYLHSYCADKYSGSRPYELGQVFIPEAAGKIKAISVYGVSGENGRHTARIWRNLDNTCIGGPYEIVFSGSNEWFVYALTVPVSIEAGIEYTVSVTTGEDPQAYYACKGTEAVFNSVQGYDPATSAPGYWRFSNQRSRYITFPANSGVYTAEIGARPVDSRGCVYYRDIEFVPDLA